MLFCRCQKCKIEYTPEIGETLFERYYTGNLTLGSMLALYKMYFIPVAMSV